MKIKPLLDKVIVQPIEVDNKTAGGIIIPDTIKEKPFQGKVIAAGPGKKDEPSVVKEGDTVLYRKGAGVEIKIKEAVYLIMLESDIFAII